MNTVYIPNDNSCDGSDSYDADDYKISWDSSNIKTETSGNIQIDSDSRNLNSGWSSNFSSQIAINDDLKEKKELSNKQLENIKRLRNCIFQYLEDNPPSPSKVKRLRSDLKKIRKMENKILKNQGGILDGSCEVLSPSELETLNSIYKRWK